MGRKLELVGRRFNRLVVLSEVGRDLDGKVTWLCLCDCGNTTTKNGSLLKAGIVKSCGCQKGRPTASHLMTGTRIYRIWANMLSRTRNANHPSYAYYGGRGIVVCDRWLEFQNFYADMGTTYREDLTIDRIDPNGNYEPGNCRWATTTEQNQNTRRNIWITFGGQTLIMGHWADRLGIPRRRLARRISVGWSHERALTEGVAPERITAVLRELEKETDEQ